jgi:hypothetical protein
LSPALTELMLGRRISAPGQSSLIRRARHETKQNKTKQNKNKKQKKKGCHCVFAAATKKAKDRSSRHIPTSMVPGAFLRPQARSHGRIARTTSPRNICFEKRTVVSQGWRGSFETKRDGAGDDGRGWGSREERDGRRKNIRRRGSEIIHDDVTKLHVLKGRLPVGYDGTKKARKSCEKCLDSDNIPALI